MTRIRDRGHVESVSQLSYATWPSGRRDEATSVYLLPQVDTMVDEVTPKFRSRSKGGEIVVNPMTKINHTSEAVLCPWWRSRTTSEGVYFNYNEAQAHTGPSDRVWAEPAVVAEIDRQETLAATSAYAGVGEADLSTLTELAELKETIGFLMSPLKKMVDITRKTANYVNRRKRFEEGFAARLARWERKNPKRRGSIPVKGKGPTLRLGNFKVTDIPSAWLAYRYAIMPLIYTFQDIQKHLDREIYPSRQTSRGRSSGIVDLSTNPAFTPARSGFGSVNYRHKRGGRAKVTSRGGVLYVPDWSVNRQLGLQLHQLPAAAYEVIPLSFVADWFYNGAEAYQAITAELRAQEILASWVTTTIEYEYTYSLESVALDAESACHPGGQTVRCHGTWKRRRKASFSDVGVRARVSLNANRVADAFALITTILANARKR